MFPGVVLASTRVSWALLTTCCRTLSRLAKKLFRLMSFHPEMGTLIGGAGANVVPKPAFSHLLSGAQCPWPARMQALSASGAE